VPQRGDLDVDQCKKPSLKHQGRIVAISARALKVLPRQVATLERSATILPLEVPAIELAAGSVRCMLAGILLAGRNLARVRGLTEG
jgi:hypothetical protein